MILWIQKLIEVPFSMEESLFTIQPEVSLEWNQITLQSSKYILALKDGEILIKFHFIAREIYLFICMFS